MSSRIPGVEIIDTQNVVPFADQETAQVRSEKAGTSGTRLACDVPAFEGPDQGFELPAAESGRLARPAGPIQVCFSGDCLNSPQGGNLSRPVANRTHSPQI
jgi:hypothetical protein